MNWAVFVLLAGSLASTARAAETRQDRAKRVINEAVQALGGDAFLHMQDRGNTAGPIRSTGSS
jgi:hypothetical protein